MSSSQRSLAVPALQVLIPGFQAFLQQEEPVETTLESKHFHAGGLSGTSRPPSCAACSGIEATMNEAVTIYRATQLKLLEKNGEWVVGAYLQPQCTRGDPLFPQTHFRIGFINERSVLFFGGNDPPIWEPDGFSTAGDVRAL